MTELRANSVFFADADRKLVAAFRSKGESSVPRTAHLQPDGTPLFINRLILESSPYLRQHAHNPINWYPWKPEAFEKAKSENKPIFLSIGYSACHWCHVMEHESFDNIRNAELLNRSFVCIKVDREQRPDVDHVYMSAVMVFQQNAGWPLSCFLTAEGKPFWATTYVPPDRFEGMLQMTSDIWRDQHDRLHRHAEKTTQVLFHMMAGWNGSDAIGRETVRQAVDKLKEEHDRQNGGFGQAPKFPRESALLLLLESVVSSRDEQVLEILHKTLDRMARGGIYDQVGGGFHRYTTDRAWQLPHFEKMLYNQALSGQVYARMYRITRNPFYGRIARETLDYVLRDMTAADGGFFSATDADSEGREGAFFVWSFDQLKRILAADEFQLAKQFYDVTEQGNFEGKNILHVPVDLETFLRRNGQTAEELFPKLDTLREKLYLEREKRVHPQRDEKKITAWNGMMVVALAEAAAVFGSEVYKKAAITASRFLLANSVEADGTVNRVHIFGKSSIPGTIDDYAYLARALVELYDLTGRAEWLSEAERIADQMLRQFWDDATGGFFMSIQDQPVDLIVRPKESADNAVPCGNSVALELLSRLFRRTGKSEYEKRATEMLSALSEAAHETPHGHTYLLMAASQLLDGETGSPAYAGRGALKVDAAVTALKKGRLFYRVNLDIRPGWHINSDRPLQESLTPTKLSFLGGETETELTKTEFPKPTLKQMGFQKEKLALFEGKVTLQGEIERPPSAVLPSDLSLFPLRLEFQVCNDSSCLLPESVVLYPTISNL